MSASGEALVLNCHSLSGTETTSVYSHIPVHNADKHVITNNATKYPKTSRSMSTCMPSSSYEALRYAVAALNRLDDFNCEKIGAGFFSEVFKVTHRTTGQVMVLKMNTSFSNRANMLREVQLMNRLSHENILRFMGVCVHEGQLHALTEYINGGSLEQLLQNKLVDLTWECRIRLSLDIARGMSYLHSRGVFHRDLTSKNVLIKMDSGGMVAVVGDFGLAEKIPDSRDKSQRLPIVGSPYWMAPECLKGAWYNEKADVFSFGIILCEIIARVEADPDILPRTENFGVDYVAFSDMCPDCPPQYLELAYTCCRIDPESRPSFKDITFQLERMLTSMSSVAGDNQLFYSPVVYTSCWDDGDSIDNVRAIFAHGWNRTNFSNKSRSREVSPNKISNTHVPQIPVTPKHVGEAMSIWDPHYKPYSTSHNPFASLPRFWKGKKFLDPSISESDMAHSVNFASLSPRDSPAPQLAEVPVECSPFSDRSTKKLSKSLPASPTFSRKSLFSEEAGENSHSPHSISPGPSFSPPSSLSPFEPDDTFSGYSSVQEQMGDCKLHDDTHKIHPSSNGESPSVVTFRTKTPSLCAKLRRSSGESGFFSVGDRNSTCDLSLESYQISEDIAKGSCDTSLDISGTALEMSWMNNSLDFQYRTDRRKRPSSCYSDDSCVCCGNHVIECLLPDHKSDVDNLHLKLQMPSEEHSKKCICDLNTDRVSCQNNKSCSLVFSSHKEAKHSNEDWQDFLTSTRAISCKQEKRIAKCMRKSCD